MLVYDSEFNFVSCTYEEEEAQEVGTFISVLKKKTQTLHTGICVSADASPDGTHHLTGFDDNAIGSSAVSRDPAARL